MRGKVKPAELVLPAFIVLLCAVVGLHTPQFLSGANAANLATQIAPLMTISVGQAIAIIGGGLDLSLASVMSLCGVLGVVLAPKIGLPAAVLVMPLAGMVIGSFSGIIIGYLKTTALIVTLGMLSVTQAFALILTNGVPLYTVPPALVGNIGFATWFGVPVTAVIALAVLLAGGFLLGWTVLGRNIYAIGSNRSAAQKSGLNAGFITVLIYAISGFCAGVAAIIETAWTSSAQPIADPNLTLQSIAACVLGGVALHGGSGTILHVLLGVLILGMLSNAMNMMGISAYYQVLAVGVVILVAVVLDRFRRR